MRLFKKKSTQAIGNDAEVYALKYLLDQGLKLKTKNFHSRFGEIDLIMLDRQTLVFVEVRCRHENAQVKASESISSEKIKKIIKTAKYYLSTLDDEINCRFDVIAMAHNGKDLEYTTEWIRDAFASF